MKHRIPLASTALLAGLTALLVSVAAWSADVTISNVRSSPTPPGVTVGAAFMTLVAEQSDTLIGASSPIAERVEMHSMTMEGDMMRMRPLAQLALPAGKTVELGPSGTHFMLLGLKQPLRPGLEYQLTLTFERAGARTVTVRVEPLPK